MGRTIEEIRAGLRQPIHGAQITLKPGQGKPGRGVYLAPYDGPMGTDDRAPMKDSKEPIKLGAKAPPNVK